MSAEKSHRANERAAAAHNRALAKRLAKTPYERGRLVGEIFQPANPRRVIGAVNRDRVFEPKGVITNLGSDAGLKKNGGF